MNTLTDLYQINDKPLLAPDADVQMSFSDLDSGESGRDEAGFMHRIVLRKKVGVWSFFYSSLTQEEYAYMLEVLNVGGSFTFTYPALSDATKAETTMAYLSQYGIVWHSSRTGQFKNLKFDIIEC